MTLSRHQDKLLQTPATLETLGSTSAVPLHRLEAWKAACVNSWIHRHGAACGKKFVSELAAGIMLVEPQQTSDNSLCSHPVVSKTSQSGITCHKLQKDRLWLQTRSQNLISKMKPFWLRLMKQ